MRQRAGTIRSLWMIALPMVVVLAFALLGCQGGSTSPAPQGGASPAVPATGVPAAPKAATKVSVALDWYPWSNHTGLYMAREKGFFREEGLEVDIYVPSNPEDVLKLVGAEKDTFGISYQSDVLLARGEGVPVKSVAALVQHPLNSVMTLKEAGLTRPKQLVGKKVGYPGIPGQEAQLSTMLAREGSSLDRVELVNVGFDLVPALISKKVDAVLGAYWVHESILAELEGFPVDVMKVEEWGVPDYYELLVVTNDKVAQQQPEVVKAFLRAVARGYAAVEQDPKAAIDLLVKVNPETKRELEDRGIKLLMPLWKDGVPTFGWQNLERWQAYAGWMKEQKLLTKEVPVETAFTTEFLPR